MDDGKITRLCPHCESPVEGGECTDAACPLGHREYPPTTADELIPSLSAPGNDAGSRRAEVLMHVHALVETSPGRPVGIGSPEWRGADPDDQIKALLVLAEAWLVEHWAEHDPDALKQASAAISGGLDWSAEAWQPSHDTLAFRREQPLYQRVCETYGCRVLFRFDEPPPADVLFNCDRHGGWVTMASLMGER